MLSIKELAGWFEQIAGVRMGMIQIETVSITSSLSMPKGLYLPVAETPDLSAAIEQGAIAALWKAGAFLPKAAPNDFPIFQAQDLLAAFETIAKNYKEKIDQEEWKPMTSFIFYENNQTRDHFFTYHLDDEKQTEQLFSSIKQYRRG